MAYGAVAFSKQTGFAFTATGYRDASTANVEAMKGCSVEAKECVLVLSDIVGDSVIAIAQGNDGAGFSSNKSAAQALADALEMCREKNRGCKVTAIYWNPKIHFSAYATYEEAGKVLAYYFTSGMLTLESAKQEALQGCNSGLPQVANKKCKIVFADSDNNKLVIVSNGVRDFFGTHYEMSLTKFIEVTLKRCKQSNPNLAGACKVKEAVENPVKSPKPKDFDAVYALTGAGKEAMQKDRSKAKPAAKSLGATTTSTHYVTCSNKCVNGSCVRTFPNGRTERWQAPRVYDTLSGDWKWDTSSCGK